MSPTQVRPPLWPPITNNHEVTRAIHVEQITLHSCRAVEQCTPVLDLLTLNVKLNTSISNSENLTLEIAPNLS